MTIGLVLPRAVPSQSAEDATASVNRTYGWYVGVGSGKPRGGLSTESIVLPHIVAIGEEFVRESLLICSEHQIDLTSLLHSALWASGEKDAERSWEALRRSWKDWHGVSFSGFPRNDQLYGVVDARNSVVHGLGSLTRQQKRGDGGRKVITRLRKSGVSVKGGDEVEIGPPAVVLAREVMTDLIDWLDLKIRSRGLWPP